MAIKFMGKNPHRKVVRQIPNQIKIWQTKD